MTPDAINDCLNRCLALRPLVGWPEWAIANYGNSTYQLQGDDELWARYAAESDSTGRCRAYRLQQILGSHEALCIWQDHLLRRLAERERLITIQRSSIFGGRWSMQIDGYDIVFADTLIEALLDVCEEVGKK